MTPKLLGILEQRIDKKILSEATIIQLLKMVNLSANFETDIGPVDAEEIIETKAQERLAEKLEERKKYLTCAEQLAELVNPAGLRELDQ